MEQIGADFAPSAVGILTHKTGGDCPRFGVDEESRRGSQVVAGLEVDSLKIAIDPPGDHSKPESRRASRDHRAVASHEQGGATQCVGGGGHMDRASVVDEGFALPSRAQGFDGRFHTLAAPRERLAEHRVLFGSVADGKHIGHSAPTEDVEYGHFFCQANGVVEGKHQRGDLDGKSAGAARHGAGENQWGGEVAVFAGMVFRENDLEAALFLAPLRELQCCCIKLGGLRVTEARSAHVESHQEHRDLLARQYGARAQPADGRLAGRLKDSGCYRVRLVFARLDGSLRGWQKFRGLVPPISGRARKIGG